MKAKEFDESKKRTCVPNWKGNMYINKLARHFNDAFLTDQDALKLLNGGYVKESAFKVLPDGYSGKKASDPESAPPAPKPKKAKTKKTK